jgi:uncharacterized membrane protein HdeD (DUF308 family)
MLIRRVRAILALTVVGVFMLITGVMAIYPLVGKTNVALNEYADLFSKTASVYTGIIGVIVGYYFGRAEDPATKEDHKTKDA